jgi:hypothetical protein
MPGGCTLSAHGARKLIVKTDRQTETEKDTYAKLCHLALDDPPISGVLTCPDPFSKCSKEADPDSIREDLF